MFRLLLLGACVGLTMAGRSPNAELIDELVRRHPEVRYSPDLVEAAKLDVPELVAKYGYPVESHDVETEDGYQLTMHRIPHGRDRNNQPNSNKPIVFLMHGLLSSSAGYLLLGPGAALGYILAEEGYDVWLGNARGNYYSRRHRSLDPDSRLNQNFWRFSWDEIGNYDLPAFLDYIESHTGQSRLHYIGHSQGGTTFLVLASLRPEYNKRFISFQGLAPASFFTNNEHPIFTSISSLESILESAAFAVGLGEILGRNWCTRTEGNQNICSMFLGSKSEYVDETLNPLFVGHTPAGASIRQVAHYGQCIRRNTFSRYNHNVITNLAIYGRITPPAYDLSKITTPSYIHYATNDLLVHPEDVHILASKLPNLKGLYLVESDVFDHFDFIQATRAYERVYHKVITAMRREEQN